MAPSRDARAAGMDDGRTACALPTPAAEVQTLCTQIACSEALARAYLQTTLGLAAPVARSRGF